MPEPSLKRSQRDSSAFGDFYRANALAMARYFACRIIDAEAVLDLVAETFAQAYASRTRFRGTTDEEARAWLYRIADRQLSAYLRRGYATRAMLERLGLQAPQPTADELARVEELGAMADLRALLIRQMDDLPKGYREAVHLRVVEELPYVDVAARLAITGTAARMRVSRALARLRAAMTMELPTKGMS